MADGLAKKGASDRTRISEEDWEVLDWSKEFGVSKDQLQAAVSKVGNAVDAPRRELRK